MSVDMLDARQILKMLVGLKEVDDLDIVSSDAVLSVTCSIDERPKVLAMAALVKRLLDDFDYEESPEYRSKVDGKSKEVQVMHRRLLTSEKRKQASRRLGGTLTEIMESREAYSLVPDTMHAQLDELKALAISITR